MALDSSAVQMLRSSSSMFMEPKSLLAPPSAVWNSSNVSEYTEPCRASDGAPLPPGVSIPAYRLLLSAPKSHRNSIPHHRRMQRKSGGEQSWRLYSRAAAVAAAAEATGGRSARNELDRDRD
uniref:Uncharacterized protein n=1 Tax=Zea mays TaxID=4577 RepID=C4J801_MAIZE|nr:unknown [Zea mays]